MQRDSGPTADIRVHTVNALFLHNHQWGVVAIPVEAGHGLSLWVLNGVFQDVFQVSNVDSHCAQHGISGHVGLGQESLGQRFLVKGHLRCTMSSLKACLM